jgi:dTDP-glucose pyrophosphorylase
VDFTHEPTNLVQAPFTWRVPLVILGAGLGRRLRGAGQGLPKVLLSVTPSSPGAGPGVSLLQVLIASWAPWTSTVHIVVAQRTAMLESVLARQPGQIAVHLQPRPTGTINALLQIRQVLQDRALVVLGDCLLAGRLAGPSIPFPGLVAWRGGTARDIQHNYSVTLKGPLVRLVQEKPRQVAPDQLCGTGVYFLNQELLDAFASVPADDNGKREITDGLAQALSCNIGLNGVLLDGRYLNINTAADLDLARSSFWLP